MLDVGRLDPVGAREVELANDADALGHVPVDTRHLVVAGGAHQRGVELLVVHADAARIGESLGRRHEPDRLQRLELRRGVGARAQPRDARQLEHDAQVVELLEAAEVDRQHVPAELRLDAEKALVAQAKQRLAHRRAADAEALRRARPRRSGRRRRAGSRGSAPSARRRRCSASLPTRGAGDAAALAPIAALMARAGSRAPRRRASRRRSGPRSGSAGRCGRIAVAPELGHRGREVAAEGRDDGRAERSRQAGARPRRAKGADRVDADQVLAGAVAHRRRRRPEQLVERPRRR